MDNKEDKIAVDECPFIHEKEAEQTLEVRTFGEHIYAVMCMLCGAVGPFGVSPEDALNRWNNRKIVILPKEDYERLVNESKRQGQGEEEVGESKEEDGKDIEKESESPSEDKETEQEAGEDIDATEETTKET